MAILRRRKPNRKFRDYRRYKPWLREDFEYSCVYCTIHEGEFGGLRNFHVEHFRPKSKFPKLEIEYTNLLYACCVCDSFKGNDWPSDNPLKSGKGYLDPCRYDYEKYFVLNVNGSIKGKVKVAIYMVEKLHLNRNFLIRNRNERKKNFESVEKFKLIISAMNKILKDGKLDPRIKRLHSIKSNIVFLLKEKEGELNKRFSPPYEPKDLR